MADTSGFPGFATDTTGASDTNLIKFLVESILAGVATVDIVRVDSVTSTGLVAPAGFVECTPLVMQVDGQGTTMRRAQLHNVPFYRQQAGYSATIMDPIKGDLGIVVYGSRDISVVKRTAKESPPGSLRHFDLADAIYLGGLVGLSGIIPTQYVQFLTDADGAPKGINIVADTVVTVSCKDAVVHASHSYSWDVDGYGERTTHTGGSNFQVDSYKDGAVVNTTEHGWTPPKLPTP